MGPEQRVCVGHVSTQWGLSTSHRRTRQASTAVSRDRGDEDTQPAGPGGSLVPPGSPPSRVDPVFPRPRAAPSLVPMTTEPGPPAGQGLIQGEGGQLEPPGAADHGQPGSALWPRRAKGWRPAAGGAVRLEGPTPAGCTSATSALDLRSVRKGDPPGTRVSLTVGHTPS